MQQKQIFCLGFASRQSIWDLKNQELFSYTIKKALLKIEATRNKTLIQKGANTGGLIFDLVNNFGWENKQKQELTGQDGKPIEFTSEASNLELATKLAHLLETALKRKKESDADSSAED